MNHEQDKKKYMKSITIRLIKVNFSLRFVGTKHRIGFEYAPNSIVF